MSKHLIVQAFKNTTCTEVVGEFTVAALIIYAPFWLPLIPRVLAMGGQ